MNSPTVFLQQFHTRPWSRSTGLRANAWAWVQSEDGKIITSPGDEKLNTLYVFSGEGSGWTSQLVATVQSVAIDIQSACQAFPGGSLSDLWSRLWFVRTTKGCLITSQPSLGGKRNIHIDKNVKKKKKERRQMMIEISSAGELSGCQNWAGGLELLLSLLRNRQTHHIEHALH